MKKSLFAALAVSSVLACTSALAVTDGVYGEVGIGAAWIDLDSHNFHTNSDNMLHLKGGLGFRSHFSLFGRDALCFCFIL